MTLSRLASTELDSASEFVLLYSIFQLFTATVHRLDTLSLYPIALTNYTYLENMIPDGTVEENMICLETGRKYDYESENMIMGGNLPKDMVRNWKAGQKYSPRSKQ
ncbi:hypothetical protein Leryth_013239 [Lithospermum erythrorhizon]|nr:hypothetical protein Leryth_013239 [Lithospermum erythrorhizon]